MRNAPILARAPTVCVIGAGVVGAATAFALGRAGWRVTLVDSLRGAGQGASYANGAQLSYSYVEPLATPATLRALPSLLLSEGSPFRWQPRCSVSHWTWLAQFLRACRQSTADQTTRDLLALSALSANTLHGWLRSLGDQTMSLHHSRPGKLVICREESSRGAAQRQIDLQATHGCEQRLVSPHECLALEPALANDQGKRIAFGVWTPSEEVIDSAALSQALACQSGATLHWDQPIGALQVRNGKIVAVGPQGEPILADHFVLAAGMASADLLRPLGVRLPIEAIKGYSLTLPVRTDSAAPTVSVTDLAHKVVYARLGNHLRVAGFAELGNTNLALAQGRIESLCASAQSIFPGACDISQVNAWAGLRPATPSGIPMVGATRWPNLWLNTGHGALGLTLAAGSAALLSDLMGSVNPSISAAPYRPIVY
jgi:D-amino-acid dehydrogenase